MSATLAMQHQTPATPASSILVRRVAVLGAGTMGSRIAAHFANAGLPVVLLDIVPPGVAGQRNLLAARAIESLHKAKPAAFYESSAAGRIIPGNFEDNLDLLAHCDWIVEAVAEDLAIKQAILGAIAPCLHPNAVVTTNTSGLPVASIAAGMSTSFRRRWFGTHFFNPPRYMRLLEFIPTPDTDPGIIAAIADFAGRRLGKSVVYARDTPNFIANRIGTFTMLSAIRLMQQQALTIEEVDALTGTAIGWPRTGTFRLADLVGLDVLASVVRNFGRLRASEAVTLPDFLEAMLERKWLGDKTGQGFYKKAGKDERGKDVLFALDWKTLEYRPAARAKFPLLEMAKNAATVAERLKLLMTADPGKDKAAAFLQPLLFQLWNYAATCLSEIAGDIPSVDQAMRAGFNWELGPFEMWDAAGTSKFLPADGATSAETTLSRPASSLVEGLLQTGRSTWYRDEGGQLWRTVYDSNTLQFKPLHCPPGMERVSDYRRSNGVIRKNPGASLIDIGQGVACIELHSPKDAIGDDIVRLITQTLRSESDAVRDFQGFVISGDGVNFSVGANLMQLLLAAQEGEWDEVDQAVRAFQAMTAAIKFCPRPVVVASYGLCLGGGTEVALHAAQRQLYAELYMGLVETSVGLVPGGGGTKEMVLRAIDASAGFLQTDPGLKPAMFAQSGEVLAALKRSFETIALAKVSTSAAEARSLGLLGTGDRISMNRDRLLTDARQTVLTLVDAGYTAPTPRHGIPVPGESALATLKLGVHLMREGEYISDHDGKVANHVANILCGGSLTAGALVTEQYLLDLERQAFLSLCGERKTLERIAFTLKTGKPLRN